MELDLIKRVYFIGAGGIGMSALARYFKKRGCLVGGYDKTRTVLTSHLEEEGILISYVDELSSLPAGFEVTAADTLIVYTPAIPKNSVLLNYFRDHGFNLQKRSQVLGIISKGQFCIAVAGTHGKTTTSSIVAHILTDTGYGCTAFLGGIATNYQSNFLLGDNNVVVVEADEYDRSFLTLHPDIAVITSMDADHLDIYGDAAQLHESFQLFAKQLKPGGTLFFKDGLPIAEGITYGSDTTATVQALNIRVEQGSFVFDYQDEKVSITDIPLMLPGKHNVENATVAIAVAIRLGIDPVKVKAAVANFKGVKRRFEYVVREDKHIYIDDYAHHPEELRACFHAVRQLYPDKKMTVVFQPHLFSRTRDFANEFAEVLSTVDSLLLLDIYPARELPMEGINSEFLRAKLTLENSGVYSNEEVLKYVKENQPELLVTVGAGDIDTLIQPLKNILTNV
ncbi:UDP-N-acetylmuramate--L-alanine ligase [Pedobacter cryoconitis]|uniref:UDP-N-acetylmuramate--L-alanine ligase n=1 Tax=Pedobacter cryoconitis TaxID=188932 RepID=A0A127V6W1_9SPHI|nr:UDP-N-acetylmuramate--L-alanine ligase [Pedobacter cryoconitis]AMP97004.1 UDP-N-acetylmuramate--L-alanine ligase [Pedobacter cryoconitis]